MILKRKQASASALERFAADRDLAGRFEELLAQARSAERALRDAQAAGASDAELRPLGQDLDTALTAVMRSAYAAQRAAIGPHGYDDRIYRRKAMATSPVKMWTLEAERLLTLRESHRLTGLVRLPRTPAV